ncbi:MAG: NACHT domain-containing protein, partial [Desulfobaccales bacterium]
MDEGREFEEEVRKVARLLWPKDIGAGAVKIDGQERDGIFISEECVHAIECTISRSQQKATDDGKKLSKVLPKIRRIFPDKAAKGWFVTKHEPTADQRSTIRSYGHDIAAVSYDVFRSKLIDAKHYLMSRKDYPFGSARDPETGNADKRTNYVSMDLCDESGNLWSLDNISSQLQNGRRLILIGDYGAGKSTTLREIFFALRSDYLNNRTYIFPILLNLRDHHGQRNAAEALERHARNIGYPQPHHLVRAWRAGYAILLLDGFDELGSPGWTGIPKRLKDLRYQSMGLIREFVADTPAYVGLIIAGRAHYFDHEKELRRSIGFQGEVNCLSLSDFTEDQVAAYLEKRGWKGEIPLW